MIYLLLYVGIFIAGVFAGYFWALYEVWSDGSTTCNPTGDPSLVQVIDQLEERVRR